MSKTFTIQTLNKISVQGLERLPRDRYQIADGVQNPDAILVRSFKMHDMALPASVKAIGRAGAGTNNIPVDKMSQAGVVVFNAPGANANAVKELVLAGILMAARNIIPAHQFTQKLTGDDAALSKLTEDGKKHFVGWELPGKTLGVIGLGAIGVKVANAAHDLGMKVLGFDPGVTVANAWQLNANIEQALSVDDIIARCDVLTVHVPLLDATKNLVNHDRLKLMKDSGVTILNFAREGIINEAALLAGLENGKIRAYICDFPTNAIYHHPKVIALPHLGASTNEAEENCAIMVADQVRDFLENGNVRNSVNFPETVMPRANNTARLCIANANVPNMVGQITSVLAKNNLNIADMLNKSRGNLAYTLVDVDGVISDAVVAELTAIEGVLSARAV